MRNRLKNLIKAYASSHSLDTRFIWEFPTHDLPSSITCTLPNSNAFRKNIALKGCLKTHLKKPEYCIEYWIIQKWGGIQGFKKNDKNDQRIAELYKRLEKGVLTKDLFGCISSLSKIASFLNPKHYAIYDSRAIFSLNWLLLKAGARNNFFPVPAGRNNEIAKYDIETILRLKCGDRRDLLLDHKTAYFEYCELLKEISAEVWDDVDRQTMPFYLEMLLFILGPQEIVADIKSCANFEILQGP
ncbi:hypothetical protein GMST_36210 [Geomonas silvestris]|uniref:Uncharacterized protein n=1 Tax=Geomonas silvestris TaxID=2740184 RepID=A0A6V8MMQ0_9BACT|nr:hypothetical protein [Geomonas silvestris]GFO61296.1 hypothetical protein GMST_36210 [Geomonas silvestris]